MPGKFVRKTVPKTTNNITTAIINFLNSEGHIAVRINVQGQWDEGLQRWRKSGSTPGVLDIGCTLAPNGKHLVIDTKRGRDVSSENQDKYALRVTQCGGIAMFVKDYEDFLYRYNLLKPFL